MPTAPPEPRGFFLGPNEGGEVALPPERSASGQPAAGWGRVKTAPRAGRGRRYWAWRCVPARRRWSPSPAIEPRRNTIGHGYPASGKSDRFTRGLRGVFPPSRVKRCAFVGIRLGSFGRRRIQVQTVCEEGATVFLRGPWLLNPLAQLNRDSRQAANAAKVAGPPLTATSPREEGKLGARGSRSRR
jgi:hypothetical protein